MIVLLKETGRGSSIRQHHIGRSKSDPASLSKESPYVVWRTLIGGLGIVTLSFLISGISILKNDLHSLWQSTFQSYRWIVLTQGNSLTVDQVGAYLKQIDLAKTVIYVSPQQALSKLQDDPFFAEDFGQLGTDLVPGSWEIEWKNDQILNAETQSDLRGEIKRLPGVLDVVSNHQISKEVSQYKTLWLKLRLVLSYTALFALCWGVVFLGRVMFFRPFKFIGLKASGWLMLIDVGWWGLGCFLAHKFIAGIHPLLISGGFVLGFFHIIWRSQLTTK